MTEHRSTPSKIDRRLTGDPIAIDGRQVQPVARVHGRWDVSGNRQSGGGMGSAKPRGIIKITPDGVHFEATVNPFQIPLAGIALGAWSIFWITWTVRAFVRR